MTITAVYHLGYEQYRHNGVGAPETGNALISMPMLLSTNPIGSIADHMAMHVSAVAHTYDRRAAPAAHDGGVAARAIRTARRLDRSPPSEPQRPAVSTASPRSRPAPVGQSCPARSPCVGRASGRRA